VERAWEDPLVGPRLHRQRERPGAANATTVVAAGAPARQKPVGSAAPGILLPILLAWVLGEVLHLQHAVAALLGDGEG
jgi:hypothetical protein